MAGSAHRGTGSTSFTRKPGHWLGINCLWALLLTPVVPVPALGDTHQQLEQRHSFDIAPQPLATALIDFARQSGIQVSVDSALIAHQTSPGSHGQHSAREALEQLLQGSGMRWKQNTEDSLTLEPAPPTGASLESPLLTPDIVVVAPEQTYQGETRIERQTIERLPVGNGDITSLLKIHPNVQFDNAQLSSKTPGEIAPANISINGAKFYQNAFLVDGMNMNNDIDPAQSNPNLLADVPGRSQGLALDTDLLEEIRVFDSNVPASHGRFNGGVVEANTRKPSKDLSGRISAQTTRSSWTKYHIDERQQDAFENSANHDEQAEFEKNILRATLEGHLTDDFGLLANFSQKRSTMPTSFYSANNVATMGQQQREQERQIDNYFLKAFWQASERLQLESSVTYAPEENTYFRGNIANSGFTTESGGTQVNFRANWDGDLARVEHSLSWNRLEQSRDSEYDDYFTWRKSSAKNWGVGNSATNLALEGGYGDIEQEQETWRYRVNADWHGFEWLGMSHNWQTGLEASRQHVRYERLTESNTYVTPRTTSTCTTSTGAVDNACSLSPTLAGWPGQYLGSRTRFITGEFDFTTTELASWIQNEIRVGNLSLRPGVRVDNDDYMNKTTVAPRFAVEYDLFADRSTVLTGGINRYYGRNITSLQLQDGRNRLRFSDTRASLNAPWVTTAHAANLVKFSELDIPYDDEWMVGLTQQWQGLEFGLKYISRKGRDQVVEVRGNLIDQPSTDPALSANYTTYANIGTSETDIITLTITPLQAYGLWGTRNTGQVAIDWMDSQSSSPDYLYPSDGENDRYVTNPWIQYEGNVIRYADRPASNYTRPWTLRLSTITEIPQWHLTWSNFLRYRAAYSEVGQTLSASNSNVWHNGEFIAVWEENRYDAALTWDMRLGWEVPTAPSQAVFMNLDVTNVLDKAVVADSSSATSTGIPTYEVGRQFMVEIGYRF